MSNPDETLREQLEVIFDTFSTQDQGETLVLHYSEQGPMIDAILQLFRTTLEDCLPKKLSEYAKVDVNNIGLVGVEQPHKYRMVSNVKAEGFNAAIAATREAFARVVG